MLRLFVMLRKQPWAEVPHRRVQAPEILGSHPVQYRFHSIGPRGELPIGAAGRSDRAPLALGQCVF